MATHLGKGEELPINFDAGTIIAFKSDKLDLSPGGEHETRLEFFNDDDDMTMRITLRRGLNRVFFNDHTPKKSLVGGWGQERSVSLDAEDINRWRRSGVTISVHNCSTSPTSEKYQILFDFTTVYFFDKRFTGPTVKVAYTEVLPSKKLLFNGRCPPQLSDPLEAFLYTLDDLPTSERRAIESGRVPLAIPASVSTETPIQPPRFISKRPWACLSWDNGEEMRIYHLGPKNILSEFAYSARTNGWYRGTLHDLEIKLDPASSIAAIRREDDIICIYYQDPESDFIQLLYQPGTDEPWRNDGLIIAKAIKGSAIAVEQNHFRVFYQNPKLYLSEAFYKNSKRQWTPGDFNPGVQPRGTPITAEVVPGGGGEIVVMWRDAHGRAMSSCWSKSLGWDLPMSGSEGLSGWD